MVLISGLRGEGKRAQGIRDGRGMMVVTSYFSPLFLSFPFSCISIFFFFTFFDSLLSLLAFTFYNIFYTTLNFLFQHFFSILIYPIFISIFLFFFFL